MVIIFFKKVFPWCGLLIDMNHLDVLIDNVRFEDTGKIKIKLDLRNTLTVDISKTPGKNLYYKTLQTLKNRAHIIYFDPRFTRPTTLHLNIFQSFLICAMRFCVYIKEAFPKHEQINMNLVLSKKKLNVDVVENCFSYEFALIKTRVGSLDGVKCPVSRQKVKWLGIIAFILVLQRKQPKFDEIVYHLQQQKRRLKLKEEKELSLVIDRDLSLSIWNICF